MKVTRYAVLGGLILIGSTGYASCTRTPPTAVRAPSASSEGTCNEPTQPPAPLPARTAGFGMCPVN